MNAYDDVLADCPATDNQGAPVRPGTDSYQSARAELLAEKEEA